MKLLKERMAFVRSVTGWSNAEFARQIGVSRAVVTNWMNGEVGALSSPVAQRMSDKTSFGVTWLATGDGDMYKAATKTTIERDVSTTKWPFVEINEQKVRTLSSKDLLRLETALLAFAQRYRLDIAEDKE